MCVLELSNFISRLAVLIFVAVRSGLPRKLYTTTGGSARFHAGVAAGLFFFFYDAQIETGRKKRVGTRVLSLSLFKRGFRSDGYISFARAAEFSQPRRQLTARRSTFV